MKKRIGIIGYGGFGKFLHHWWEKLDEVEITAIADTRLDRDRRDNYTIYRSWKDLIASDEVDIVSIVTPPVFHSQMACAAMRAGKHVLLEKPVAVSADGAQEIMQVREETGQRVMVNHMLRYNPIISSIIELSLSNVFGKLRHAVVNNYAQDAGLPEEHWFWNREMSGGIFIEHRLHFIDIINGLTRQHHIQVNGLAHNRNLLQRDQVAAMVLYNEGLIASHYHSFSGPGFFEQTTINLNYDLAKIEIRGWIPMEGKVIALVNAGSKLAIESIPGWQTDGLQPISALQDVSRPEGWGDVKEPQSVVQAGGISYDVSDMVSGTFSLQGSKGDIYGACVQDIMKDLIRSIDEPTNQPRVSLENACESLRIAIKASVAGADEIRGTDQNLF